MVGKYPWTLWPKGTYGLPMPKSGCPFSSNNQTWLEGFYTQDTENTENYNLVSPNILLAGDFNNRKILWQSCDHLAVCTNVFLRLRIPCYFSASRVLDFGIVNRYSWFWNSLNMVDWGSEFSFFRSIHVRIDMKIGVAISIGLMTTKSDEQVHLKNLIQMTLIRQVLVKPSSQDQMAS